MRARWALTLTTALAVTFGAVAAPAASATEPVSLDSGYVLDEADVLSDAEASAAQDRLEQLFDDTGLDLWVVFVDEFTDPTDRAEWANAVAGMNGLGPAQYLLAVAVDGRQFYIHGWPEGPVTDEQLGTIEQERVRPALGDEDWAGAIDAAADGFTDVAAGGSGGADGAGGAASDGVNWSLILLVVLLIAVFASALIWLAVRRRRRGASGDDTPVAQLSLEELERRSGAALVATDDAVKTSEQELGFARAQFGDDAVAEFATVLAQAKADLDTAFSLQQKLDDTTPDTEDQVRAWRGEILRLTTAADEALDAKAADFDALRDLERNAPAELARTQQDRGEVAAALASAESRLSTLQAAYADAAVATVADNPAQARERLAFADAQLGEAANDLAAGRTGEAAVGIRAAQEAVAQARLLEDAITRLAEDLATADERAGALAREVENDITTASALPDPDGRIGAAVTAAREQLTRAREAMTGGARRPLEALAGLDAANEALDAVIAQGRDAAERQRRAAQQIDQALLQARAHVSAAEDFIGARRGAVGAEARTRLAEAGASLAQAEQLRATDPAGALASAQRAAQLAASAAQSAQNDVGAFGGYGPGYGGGGSSGDGMMGAILGGIVLNSLLGGGGGRGGGFGGGFGGGGRGGGFGGGRVRSGGFGGSGARLRRGGGRF